jgi:hypothetical protein
MKGFHIMSNQQNITLFLIALLLVPLAALQAAEVEPPLRVSDFSALGDGFHDDGPAIAAAFGAAKADGGASTVVFEKKTYRLGDNPMAWHYFQMLDHEDLVIEGGGATLLCAEGNLAFYFEGGRDITVRGLTLDTIKPTFTQGEVVAVDASGTLDVKVMDGYPEPPDEAFLTSNNYLAHGGGGRHMIVFEKGGEARNTAMGSDHLYIRNIARVSPGVFRFHVKEDYLPHFKGVSVGNWVSYGFNKANLPAAVVATKDKSASTYGQIAANRVGNITFEDLNIFSSLNGGIRVSDMFGDVALRKVRLVRKPGTRNLLSTVSDALHLMSIRGKLTVEGCEVEAPGDDCLNIGTLLENVMEVSKEDPKVMTLRTTDNRFYHYTIRPGDELQFLDMKTKRELAIAKVVEVTSDPRHRTHRVVLDHKVSDLDPSLVLVLNLNQMTSSAILRNNTMKPYMRNAMLVRARKMNIEGNHLDGTHGGVLGLNFCYSMEEIARLRDIRVTGNTIIGFGSYGLLLMNPFRDRDGGWDAQKIVITDNAFHVADAKAIRVCGVRNLSMEGNRFENKGMAAEQASKFVEISDCVDLQLKD